MAAAIDPDTYYTITVPWNNAILSAVSDEDGLHSIRAFKATDNPHTHQVWRLVPALDGSYHIHNLQLGPGSSLTLPYDNGPVILPGKNEMQHVLLVQYGNESGDDGLAYHLSHARDPDGRFEIDWNDSENHGKLYFEDSIDQLQPLDMSVLLFTPISEDDVAGEDVADLISKMNAGIEREEDEL